MKKLLIVVLTALLMLFVSFRLGVSALAGMPGFFRSAFEACGSVEETGVSIEELMRVHLLTTGYIKGEEDSLHIVCERYDGPIEFYKEDEKAHLQDVRDLYRVSGKLLIPAVPALLAAIVILLFRKDGGRDIRTSCTVCLAVTLACTLFPDTAFTVFHRILFPQGNWIFYPDISLMVKLYSDGVFLRCGIFTGAVAAAFFGALFLVSIISDRKRINL